MAPPIGLRKQGTWIIVSITPDVCKTPMGAATPSVAYQIVAEGLDSCDTVKTVQFNGEQAFVWDSRIKFVKGDELGVAGGLVSGTNVAECEPIDCSSTVRANSSYLVREGDRFWMNNRNCVGVAIYVESSDGSLSSQDRQLLLRRFIEQNAAAADSAASLATDGMRYIDGLEGATIDDVLAVYSHPNTSIMGSLRHGVGEGANSAGDTFRSISAEKGLGFPSPMDDGTTNQIYHTFSFVGYGCHSGGTLAAWLNVYHENFDIFDLQGHSIEDELASAWGINVGLSICGAEKLSLTKAADEMDKSLNNDKFWGEVERDIE
jgi:hypothetical protein